MRLVLLAVVALAAPAFAQSPGTTIPPESGIVGTLPGLPPNGLTGQGNSDVFGQAAASAGDVNGDGHPDVIVGAPYNDASATNAGRAYVYFGGPAMDDEPDVVLAGAAAGDQYGRTAASAGDVNGDGYDDVIVGAPFNDAAGTDAGRAYLYFGGPTMDATPDLVFTGAVATDYFGYAVAGVGDLNGDGFDDVAVGAPLQDSGGADRGRVYVYFGGAAMNTVADVIPRGQAAGDLFGVSVAAAGDVNGDGYPDLLVGATGNTSAGVGAGRAYVVFGGAAMDQSVDVVLTGAAAGDQFGWAVAGAGDLDGDGFDDVIVGAPNNDAGGVNAGRAYIYFGSAAMNSGADLTITGQEVDGFLGIAVAGVGDVDGDGAPDLAAGAAYTNTIAQDAGAVFLYLGGPNLDAAADASIFGRAANEWMGSSVGAAGDLDGDGRAEILAGATGFDGGRGRVSVVGVRLTGEDLPDAVFTGAAAGDWFGRSVASAGDVNGDGYDDVIVGANFNDAGGSDAGRAYVYFGGPGADTVADVTLTGAAAGDLFGFSVSGAGDVNGDGYDDVIVGARANDAGGAEAGRAYVYYGGATMNAVADVTLTGAAASDQFGLSVSGAGDVNGDGYDDVVVGAYLNDAGGSDAGRAYVYYGGTAMDSSADVTMTGEAAGDRFGFSVSGAGDVNGDGYDDVVVGAYLNDAGGSDAGRAYVYYGGVAMNNGADVTLTGAAAGDRFGYSVSGAGDVNGDGYDDVVVGAYDNDAGGSDAGRAYVYYGGAAMNNGADVTLTGAAAGDNFGYSVSGAGDVNGDGYDDVVVGAYLNDAGGSDAGRAYVYFGGVAMDSGADVTMTGEAAFDNLGISVSGAGDVNGDGAADLIAGAIFNDAGGTDAGRAYLYLSTYPAAAPRIAAVRDVPDDQGGFVTAEWTASAYDGAGDDRVTAYLVQRSRADGPPAWELVSSVPATEEIRYSAVVPTYGVPAEGTSQPTRVRVTAITASDGEFFRSGIVTGASVDNIAPPAPLSPTASPSDAGVAVSWAAPPAPDLAGYAVYRSATAGVTPSDETRVATLDAVTTWTDAGVGPGVWFYVVTARDASGNEGAPSTEASTATTSGEDGPPTAFALSPVAPNPASGAVTVRFALPTASPVRVVVYDATGREVARPVDGERAAGWHTASLDAHRLAAGAYVIRMEAGALASPTSRFVATRRLSVVR